MNINEYYDDEDHEDDEDDDFVSNHAVSGNDRIEESEHERDIWGDNYFAVGKLLFFCYFVL